MLIKKVIMEGLSITKLLVIGALIVLLFGTNKLRSLGGDLGAAIKGFKKAMNDEPAAPKTQTEEPPVNPQVTEHKD
jgi:Sec-independent protein translocase protein TatE